MANEIKQKFGANTPAYIQMANLPSSASGVGVQTAMIDNSTTAYQQVFVHVSGTQGTSPTINRGIYVWGIRGDGTRRDDNAQSASGTLTMVNAQLLGVLNNTQNAVTSGVLAGVAIFQDPGKEFGIGISQDTGAALSSLSGVHGISWYGANPEVQ